MQLLNTEHNWRTLVLWTVILGGFSHIVMITWGGVLTPPGESTELTGFVCSRCACQPGRALRRSPGWFWRICWSAWSRTRSCTAHSPSTKPCCLRCDLLLWSCVDVYLLFFFIPVCKWIFESFCFWFWRKTQLCYGWLNIWGSSWLQTLRSFFCQDNGAAQASEEELTQNTDWPWMFVFTENSNVLCEFTLVSQTHRHIVCLLTLWRDPKTPGFGFVLSSSSAFHFCLLWLWSRETGGGAALTCIFIQTCVQSRAMPEDSRTLCSKYSLNWDESTPPPLEPETLNPAWWKRSRTCTQKRTRWVSELL